MSEIVYYITTNETVLTEQYTNDKSLGKAPPPEADTLLALVRSMEAANLPDF